MHPHNKCPLLMCYNGAMKIKVVTLPTPFLLPALRNFLLLMETLNTATWEGGINVYNREGVKRSTIVVSESYAFPLKSVLNLVSSLKAVNLGSWRPHRLHGEILCVSSNVALNAKLVDKFKGVIHTCIHRHEKKSQVRVEALNYFGEDHLRSTHML